jgi:hypothetical protein
VTVSGHSSESKLRQNVIIMPSDNVDKVREFIDASKSKGASDEFLATFRARRQKN